MRIMRLLIHRQGVARRQHIGRGVHVVRLDSDAVTPPWSCTITGNPASKKTSNRIVRAGRRMRVLPSLVHERWFKLALPQVRAQRGAREPIQGPVQVRALFYRDDRRRVDLSNLMEAVADLLQRAGVIADDCQIESWDGSRKSVDKDRPRVEVAVEELATG